MIKDSFVINWCYQTANIKVKYSEKSGPPVQFSNVVGTFHLGTRCLCFRAQVPRKYDIPICHLYGKWEKKKISHNRLKDKLLISCFWLFWQNYFCLHKRGWFLFWNLFFFTVLIPILQHSSSFSFYDNTNTESNNDMLSNAVFPYSWTLIYLLTAS